MARWILQNQFKRSSEQIQTAIENLLTQESIMIEKYHFKSYPGKVLLFNAMLPTRYHILPSSEEEEYLKNYLKEQEFSTHHQNNWFKYITDLTEIKLECDHMSIMDQNNLKVVSRYIKEWMMNDFK